MILNLLDRLAAITRSRVEDHRAVDGNPLFAEELVAMLVDEELLRRDEDRWVARSDLSELPVPSTINALLAARLEGLPAVERAILTAAAVEGAVFHRSAVSELARPALDGTRGRLARARPPGSDPPRGAVVRRRERLSLPSRPDPRRRVSLAAEERARRPARALRRLARANGRGPATRVRGDCRLSSRTGLPVPCRARSARRACGVACRPGVPSGSRQPGGGRLSAATCRRRSACSSGFPGSFPPTIHGGSRCSPSWAPR